MSERERRGASGTTPLVTFTAADIRSRDEKASGASAPLAGIPESARGGT
jgi:hypothetical protein